MLISILKTDERLLETTVLFIMKCLIELLKTSFVNYTQEGEAKAILWFFHHINAIFLS